MTWRHLAGDERPGRIPADIVFTIAESPHPVFKREGNDLVYTARLPLADALSGTTVNLMHLDGRPVSVPVQDVRTQPSSSSNLATLWLHCSAGS